MRSDFLLIYSKTWPSICNPLKRTEMNLREAAVWMPRTGSPPWGLGGLEPQPGTAWVGGCLSTKRAQASLAGERVGPSG